MNTWTCEQVDGMIDLYAADECDASVRSAVKRHLDACPACRESSHQARQLLGLLDQRFQESERLHRLGTRLDAEPRRTRRVTPATVWRFAALAAAVLAAFGLSTLVAPTAAPSPGLQLTANLSPPSARAAPLEMAVRNDSPSESVERARQNRTDAADAEVLPLDLQGKTPEAFRRALRAAADGGNPPPPPALHLVLEMHNAGQDALALRFGDEGAALSLDLRGPGAVAAPAPGAAAPLAGLGVVRLGPGDTLRLPVRRSAYGSRGAVRYAYWTEPGEYTLTVTIRVPTETGPLAPAREVAVTAGPFRLRVGGR